MRRSRSWTGVAMGGLVVMTLSLLSITQADAAPLAARGGAQSDAAPSVATRAPTSAAAIAGIPFTVGDNSVGQLGDGTTTAKLTAHAVPGLDDIAQLDGGRAHVVALTDQGTVVTWGNNEYGELGIGVIGGSRNTPQDVPGLTDIAAVTTGHYSSLALGSDGSVWTWGYNASGQLGDGTTKNSGTPVHIDPTHTYSQIAAGRDMSYGIRTDGTLWAWGLNTDGELGNGTKTNSSTPVQVSGLSGVVAVAGGRDHGLAILADQSVWAWGWNAYGMVGNGTTVDQLTPVQIATDGQEVAAGAHHSYLLKTDGTVWAWGRNYRDELGDGTVTNRSTPVQVHNVTGAVAVGSGRDDGMAVLSDGTVRAWGYNASGQLGDGTTTSRSTPVTMLGVSDAVDVGGGDAYSVILTSDGTPPVNQPPRAVITSSCADLTCHFSAAGSSDPDGTIVSYAWDFGDGNTADTSTADNTYAADDTYPVTLTVVDNDGAITIASTSVTVPVVVPPPAVAFRAGVSANMQAKTAKVTVPATVQAGDQLLLFVATAASVTATTPAGWTLLGTQPDDVLQTRVYTRSATATSHGTAVSLTLGSSVKVTLSLLAYSDAAPITTATGAAAPGNTKAHASPAVSVGDGGWVASYWVDKTSGNTGWTLPSSVSRRTAGVGSGSGRLTSVGGDSGPLAAGTWPGATATSAVVSTRAVAWSVVIAPS